ncbi:MAG: SufE family protein [Candidatus Melainabacteria bacterium]
MRPIEEIEREIVEEFARFNNWADKYKHLIDLGKVVPELPEQYRKDKYKVSGCQAQVWLFAELTEQELQGGIHFYADSDALIVKGLISLLLRYYSGQEPAIIIQKDPLFINMIGLDKHLSANRSNGLAAMIKQMKMYSYALKTLQGRSIEN